MKPSQQASLLATAFISKDQQAIVPPVLLSSFIHSSPPALSNSIISGGSGSHQNCGNGIGSHCRSSMAPLSTLNSSVRTNTNILTIHGMRSSASSSNTPPPMSPETSASPLLKGVVLDMDGTLTMPTIDFAKMYEDCNVPKGCDILAEIERMDPAEADRCRSIISQMEDEARRSMVLMPGAVELGRWLHLHGIPFALVTRNTARTVETLVDAWSEKGGPPFEIVLSRDECNGLPPKPHPASLIEIASKWNIDVSSSSSSSAAEYKNGGGDSVVMVGDSLRHDVAFGKAAGVSTALLDISSSSSSHNGDESCSNSSSDDGQPDFHVNGLWELPSLLCRHRTIPGLLGTGQSLKYYGIPPGPSSRACLAAHSGAVTLLKTLPPEELLAPEDDASGNTPLIWAADQGKVEVVRYLLTIPNVDVNYRGYLGSTAMNRAARKGHAEIVRLLAKEGKADMEIPNLKMQYPLHFAAFKLNEDAVDALLECGASTLVLDRKGRTPADDTSDARIREKILSARRKALGQSFCSTS